MIYNNKLGTFNYPIFRTDSNAYADSIFELDISEVNEVQNTYKFFYSINISSKFIRDLIELKKAELIIVVQSKDNFYTKINEYSGSIIIEKNQLSLKDSTLIQVLINTTQEVNFIQCFELTQLFNQLKHDITVEKHGLLGYSNVEILNGINTKAVELFEYSTDKNMSIPFKVELNETSIVLRFKDMKYSFNQLANFRSLRNMYIYAGLSRAIHQFILNNLNEENRNSGDYYVEIGQLDVTTLSVLDRKLYDLMVNKAITELDLLSIDEVVNKLSVKIVEKYVDDLLEVANSEA